MSNINLRKEVFKSLESYIEFLKNDYAKWTNASKTGERKWQR
jgi:hypothetical protein